MSEEAAHGHGRATGTRLGAPLRDPAALEAQPGAGRLSLGAGETLDLRHRGDAGQGLAAEAERSELAQVLQPLQLTGSVALESEGRLGGGDAEAVVGDADQARAAALDLDLDGAGTAVDGVLDQLLDDRGGSSGMGMGLF